MKKSIFALAGLLATVLMPSCSSEGVVSPAETDNGQITFQLAVPSSLKSRAFGDGTTARTMSITTSTTRPTPQPLC